MLRQVRKSLQKVVLAFVMGLIALSFALWGVPELRNFTQRSPLVVGDAGFTSQELLNAYNLERIARRNESGGRFDPDDADELGEQVVSRLVTDSVLQQEATRMGLVAPRSLVREYLHTDERFQNPATGKFDQFALQTILSGNNMTLGQFEDVLREALLRSQLVSSIAEGPPVPDALAEALILREIERRQVGYLTITDEMAGVPAEPTPDALKTYYDEHQSAFMAPEYRTFTAVVLKESDFSEGLAPPDEELRKVYETNKARLYDSPEMRTRYQITYDVESEAQAAVAALKQGKPFENVASEKGFSLQQVTFEQAKSEVLDPAVAEAVYAADVKEGDIVGPVAGVFGWTVVQLAGVTPPSTKTFEEVRDEIAAQYTSDDARKRLGDAVDKIEEGRDTGAALADAAEAAGFAATEYGPVDAFSLAPGGAIVPDVPAEALAEAFKLEEGDESSAVPFDSGDGYFFVHVTAVTPPAIRRFEDVMAETERLWRRDERSARIAAAVKQVTDAVAAGSTLEDAAAPFNRAVLVQVLDRGARQDGFSPALLEEAFKADKGAVISGEAGSGEAQTIVEIREIGYARSRVGPAEEAAYAQYLRYQLDQELLEAYIASLREDYRVRADEDALASLFNEGQ